MITLAGKILGRDQRERIGIVADERFAIVARRDDQDDPGAYRARSPVVGENPAPPPPAKD